MGHRNWKTHDTNTDRRRRTRRPHTSEETDCKTLGDTHTDSDRTKRSSGSSPRGRRDVQRRDTLFYCRLKDNEPPHVCTRWRKTLRTRELGSGVSRHPSSQRLDRVETFGTKSNTVSERFPFIGPILGRTPLLVGTRRPLTDTSNTGPSNRHLFIGGFPYRTHTERKIPSRPTPCPTRQHQRRGTRLIRSDRPYGSPKTRLNRCS